MPITYSTSQAPNNFFSNHRFVADGKLYLAGNMSGVDTANNWSLLSTTDLSNWTWEFQDRLTDIFGKIDLPNGKSVYMGARAYVDNPDPQAEQVTYYYWMEDFSDPTPPMYPIMPTLNVGASYGDGSRNDCYFYYPMFTVPIVRGNYLYWPLVVYKTQQSRLDEWNTQISPLIDIWVVRISVEDFMLGKYWTKVAEITNFESINSESGDEPTWIEYPDGEVVMLIRSQFGENVSTYGAGIAISRSNDLINWSTPVFGFDGFPATGFVDHDGTTYVGTSQRPYREIDNHNETGDGKNHLITSMDKLVTLTDQALNTFQTYGYNGAVRYKDKLVMSYVTAPLPYDTWLIISNLAPITLQLQQNGNQLTLLANGVDVTNAAHWKTADSQIATVYKGQITPVVNTSMVTVTAEYWGNVITQDISLSIVRKLTAPHNFNRPLNKYNLVESNISLPIYSDSGCTVSGEVLGSLALGQVTTIDRYIKNETSRPIAVQLYDQNESGVVTYSWDTTNYADPTEWVLINPGEVKNFKVKVDLTSYNQAQTFSVGKRVRG